MFIENMEIAILVKIIKIMQSGVFECVCVLVRHVFVTWRLPGGCLAAAWRLPGGYLAAAWRLPGGCLAAAWHLPSGCLAATLRLPGGYLAAACRLPGGYLAATWRLAAWRPPEKQTLEAGGCLADADGSETAQWAPTNHQNKSNGFKNI